eukprot:2046291-Rhodomonas_salina.2
MPDAKNNSDGRYPAHRNEDEQSDTPCRRIADVRIRHRRANVSHAQKDATEQRSSAIQSSVFDQRPLQALIFVEVPRFDVGRLEGEKDPPVELAHGVDSEPHDFQRILPSLQDYILVDIANGPPLLHGAASRDQFRFADVFVVIDAPLEIYNVKVDRNKCD